MELYNNLHLRFADEHEAHDLINIQVDALSNIREEFYKPNEISLWIDSLDVSTYEAGIRNQEIIVAQIDNTIVGFGQYKIEWSEIKELYVHSNYQRQGIGRMIEEKLEDIASANEVKTLRIFASLNAQNFYQSLGFAYIQNYNLEISTGILLPFIQMEKLLVEKNNY